MKFFFLIFYLYAFRKSTDGSDFYIGQVVHNQESAQVFINMEVLRATCDPLIKELHFDATFKAVPTIFYQLAILQTVAYGHVITIVFIYVI